MMGRHKRAYFPILCLLALAISASRPALSGSRETDGWLQADRPREWRFPRDHGVHPGFRTEWWYFTGIVAGKNGEKYGYQLTFFRQGVRLRPLEPQNPWSIRDLYLAHFTVTNARTGEFFVNERVSRTGPGLAGARQDALGVHLLDWHAEQRGTRFVLFASNSGTELRLDLSPSKPLVIHGENGLSRKGDKPGQASYYVSHTRLSTTGTLKLPKSPVTVSVKGSSWFDHEFGSNQLTTNQAGWDWFSLRLSDGRDLMLYILRRTDGSVEPASSGTLVDRTGDAHHLSLSELRVGVLDHWKSPKSQAKYPSRWRITISSEGIDLVASPVVPDQELLTPGSTGVTYWEGAVEGEGTSGGRRVTAEGYVELTGYAGNLGGVF